MRSQTIIRLRWLCIVVVSAAYAILAGCHRSTPPNILLYVVDTLRFDAPHGNGNEAVQTPAMDRLAREGMRFARAYANASWTRASMGSLLSGEYPSTHGAVGRPDALRAGIATLPAQLQALGYRTAAIIANPNIGSSFGFAAGFGEFVELYRPHPGHQPVQPEQLIATADQVVDRAQAWLRRNTATPFFLLVFTIDPHAPYTPPAPYNSMYDPDYQGSVDGSFKSLFALALMGKTPPEREIRHLRALYHGEVTFNDAQLGRLLATLDDQRLTDSTLFAVTSDHGEEFYEHGGRDHGHTLYEELLHVPLIMRWPGHIAAEQTYTGAVQLVDLSPTLLRLAGTTPPRGPGRDLSAVLRGRADSGVASLVYAEEDLDGHNLRAVILDQQKLIFDVAASSRLSFDLSTDPGELHALPGIPPHDLLTAMSEIESANRAAPGTTPRIVSTTQLPESARQALEALGYGEPTNP